MFAGMSYTGLYFGPYQVALLGYNNYKFPVNGKTKMTFSWSRHTCTDNEIFSILVEDGLRQAIWVEVDAITTRMLLVCYAHVQGFTLARAFSPWKYLCSSEDPRRLVTPIYHSIQGWVDNLGPRLAELTV